MILTDKEYSVINRIADACKMDWFLIGQDEIRGDYVCDLESQTEMSLRDGILQLCEGIVSDQHLIDYCDITQEEIDLFHCVLVNLGLENNFELGDKTVVISQPVINIQNIDFFDDLEYDCWNLFKQYLGAFDIQIVPEEDGDYDDIDFSIAKEIQEKVLEIIENGGIKLEFD